MLNAHFSVFIFLTFIFTVDLQRYRENKCPITFGVATGPNLHCNCWFVYPVRLLWCVKEIELLPVVVLSLKPGSGPGSAPGLNCGAQSQACGPFGRIGPTFTARAPHTHCGSFWCQSRVLGSSMQDLMFDHMLLYSTVLAWALHQSNHSKASTTAVQHVPTTTSCSYRKKTRKHAILWTQKHLSPGYAVTLCKQMRLWPLQTGSGLLHCPLSRHWARAFPLRM